MEQTELTLLIDHSYALLVLRSLQAREGAAEALQIAPETDVIEVALRVLPVPGHPLEIPERDGIRALPSQAMIHSEETTGEAQLPACERIHRTAAGVVEPRRRLQWHAEMAPQQRAPPPLPRSRGKAARRCGTLCRIPMGSRVWRALRKLDGPHGRGLGAGSLRCAAPSTLVRRGSPSAGVEEITTLLLRGVLSVVQIFINKHLSLIHI